jgi:hypothetical protein
MEKLDDNFKFISHQMWWIIDVGFSHALDRKNATKRKGNTYISIAKLLIFSIDLWRIAYLVRSLT